MQYPIFATLLFVALSGCSTDTSDTEPKPRQEALLMESPVALPAGISPIPEHLAWYERDVLPANLKTALVLHREFLGARDSGWKTQAGSHTCAAFQSVKLSCDLNTLRTLDLFLGTSGKELIPLEDGYAIERSHDATIAAAVRRNAFLFTNGDLKAMDVQKYWH